MKLSLEGSIKFSKSISKDDITPIVSDLNDKLKGEIKEEDEKPSLIVDYRIDENTINVKIESEKYTRSHVVLLRFKKQLEKKICPKIRAGIRDILVSRYNIFLDSFTGDINLPLVKKIERVGDDTKLIFENLSERVIQTNVIDRIIKLIQEKVVAKKYKGKAEYWSELKRSKEKEMLFDADPTKKAQELGWMKRYPGVGQWVFTPPLSHLMRKIEHITVEYIAKEVGFSEIILPKLIPLEIHKKTGHLLGVPQEMYFASPSNKREFEYFEDISDKIKVYNEIFNEEIHQKLRPAMYNLCYAQCESFYWFFSKEIIDKKILPIKWIDKSGPSYRWESGGIHGLERLNEFHRIEFVWLGEPEDVIKIRDELLEKSLHVLDDIFELEWRCAEVMPVYLAHEGKMDFNGTKEGAIGTIDLETYLPYRGDRKTSEWLEVCAYSIHKDRYTSSFKIKEKKNRDLWTGCVGIGLERWIASFLAQKGFDFDRWPDKFKKIVKKLPKVPKLVTWP